MLFAGRIYIVRVPWYFGGYRNIFLPNIGKETKKNLPERGTLGSPALCPMLNPALVIALRS